MEKKTVEKRERERVRMTRYQSGMDATDSNVRLAASAALEAVLMHCDPFGHGLHVVWLMLRVDL